MKLVVCPDAAVVKQNRQSNVDRARANELANFWRTADSFKGYVGLSVNFVDRTVEVTLRRVTNEGASPGQVARATQLHYPARADVVNRRFRRARKDGRNGVEPHGS